MRAKNAHICIRQHNETVTYATSISLSKYLIGIVGAGYQTEESCQRVRRWIRDFPHLEQIHKTTYAQMIYTALCVMLLMRAASITLASGRELGPGNLDAISQGTKKSPFPGPNPLPLALLMDDTRIKRITHGAV